MVAFVHSLEASAQDDALEVLDRLLRDIFGAAEKADRKARLRSLKDLDALALTLAHACAALLDPALPDNVLRDHVFARVPRATLAEALGTLSTLVRPPDDVFYTELQTRYRRVRLFLPTLLHQVHFEAAPAGAAVVAALEYLKRREAPARVQDVAPSAGRDDSLAAIRVRRERPRSITGPTPSASSTNCARRCAGGMSS